MSRSQQLRRAIEWVGRQGQHDTESLEFAARRFDLSPAEEQFLLDEFGESKREFAPPSGQARATHHAVLKVISDGAADGLERALLERAVLAGDPMDELERVRFSRLFGRLSEDDLSEEAREAIRLFKQAHQIP